MSAMHGRDVLGVWEGAPILRTMCESARQCVTVVPSFFLLLNRWRRYICARGPVAIRSALVWRRRGVGNTRATYPLAVVAHEGRRQGVPLQEIDLPDEVVRRAPQCQAGILELGVRASEELEEAPSAELVAPCGIARI